MMAMGHPAIRASEPQTRAALVNLRDIVDRVGGRDGIGVAHRYVYKGPDVTPLARAWNPEVAIFIRLTTYFDKHLPPTIRRKIVT